MIKVFIKTFVLATITLMMAMFSFMTLGAIRAHIGTNIIEEAPWKRAGISLLILTLATSTGVATPSWILNRTAVTNWHKYMVAIAVIIVGIWKISIY